MKSAVTISQVPEAAEGPFVLRGPLPEAFASAAAIGFDAVELFLPGPDFVTVDEVKSLAAANKLAIAAVGTGAGMLRHGFSITDASPDRREAAIGFVLAMIDFGGALKAPAILGSMQGRRGPDVSRDEAVGLLAAGLRRCAERAESHGVKFIYELKNVVLLADLFHMNIEERDVPAAIREAGRHIGHVHFADSNRHAMGFGHTDAAPALAALREVGYAGYLSAEILPLPDPESAARQTIFSLRSLLSYFDTK
jgi:sugar phosphate isomerase/epimerase